MALEGAEAAVAANAAGYKSQGGQVSFQTQLVQLLIKVADKTAGRS